MVRAFNPLLADHPLVALAWICPYCQKTFLAGEVPCLVPFKPSEPGSLTWEAKPAHWDCYQKSVGD